MESGHGCGTVCMVYAMHNAHRSMIITKQFMCIQSETEPASQSVSLFFYHFIICVIDEHIFQYQIVLCYCQCSAKRGREQDRERESKRTDTKSIIHSCIDIKVDNVAVEDGFQPMLTCINAYIRISICGV